MQKVKIMTDSVSDIPKDVCEKLGITKVALGVNFSDGPYIAPDDGGLDAFFDKINALNEIPSTAQATPGEFYAQYKKALDEGYESIIVVTMSSTGSGTFQSANIAKQMLLEERQVPIEVIDSMGYTYMYGHSVTAAAKAAIEDVSFDEIVSNIKKEVAGAKLYFALGNLENIRKGGRISSAVAFVGKLLDIKLILNIQGGIGAQYDKVRGRKNIVPKLMEIVDRDFDVTKNNTIYVIHAKIRELTDQLKIELQNKYGNKANILEAQFGPVLAAHSGEEMVGVVLFNDDK